MLLCYANIDVVFVLDQTFPVNCLPHIQNRFCVRDRHAGENKDKETQHAQLKFNTPTIIMKH